MSEKNPYETGESPERQGNPRLPTPVQRGTFYKYGRNGQELLIGDEEDRLLQANLTARGIGQCAVDSCGSRLIYRVAWEDLPKKIESDDTEERRYRIECRCPECEMFVVVDAPQSELEIFNDQINDGAEGLMIALRKLARSNMEYFVETFSRYVNDDHILPEDF